MITNNEIEHLIDKYKKRISSLQNRQKNFEIRGMAGVCISLQGEIFTYNAVISDLKKLIK